MSHPFLRAEVSWAPQLCSVTYVSCEQPKPVSEGNSERNYCGRAELTHTTSCVSSSWLFLFSQKQIYSGENKNSSVFSKFPLCDFSVLSCMVQTCTPYVILAGYLGPTQPEKWFTATLPTAAGSMRCLQQNHSSTCHLSNAPAAWQLKAPSANAGSGSELLCPGEAWLHLWSLMHPPFNSFKSPLRF